MIDLQNKIASTLYDKSITYTNLIIMAGYAGFFGLWSYTKNLLTTKQVFWSALFLIISLSVFVFFEVGKMIFNSCFMLSRNSAINRMSGAKTIEGIISLLKEHDETTNLRKVKFIVFWIVANIVIIPTAILGMSILMYSFIINLVTLYNK
jgi:hypothetical protein